MFTLLAEFARMERETLSERILSGMEEARRKGKHLGRPDGSLENKETFLKKYPSVVRNLRHGISVRKTAKICDTSDFLSDGVDNLRKLQTYLNAESTHILDWFHITMRLTVLNQYVLGMLKVDDKIGNNLQELIVSIKWNLWHGKVGEALQKVEEIEDYLEEHKEDKEQKHRYEKQKAFDNNADEFRTYISNNRNFIVYYSDRYHYGESITTSFIESTVNYVIAKRFSKKQSMQWTKKGTH
jgi:hypothetical protein